MPEDTVDREAMRAAAALMGSARSERKTKAARENAKLGGGSVKKFTPCISGLPHRWKHGRCRFCGGTKKALKLMKEANQ